VVSSQNKIIDRTKLKAIILFRGNLIMFVITAENILPFGNIMTLRNPGFVVRILF